MKRCGRCKETKEDSSYYHLRKYDNRHKKCYPGLSSWCRKCIMEINHNTHEKYKDERNERRRLDYKENPEIKIKTRAYVKEILEDWKAILPKNPTCEICGKNLYYFSGKQHASVNFDHKHDNLPIKLTPCHWLKGHAPNEKHIKIWNECNFGVLCANCNLRLPTKDRKLWLERVTKYVNG